MRLHQCFFAVAEIDQSRTTCHYLTLGLIVVPVALVVAAVCWCALIAGTSSTVILPHDFFIWVASHVFRDEMSFRKFVVFWGYSWFAIVKGWHAAEFAILSLFALAVLDKLAGSRLRRNVALAMGFCLLFAVSDEYHQTFVPGRGGTWTDVVIDGLGVAVAALIAWRRRAAAPSPRTHAAEPGAQS